MSNHQMDAASQVPLARVVFVDCGTPKDCEFGTNLYGEISVLGALSRLIPRLKDGSGNAKVEKVVSLLPLAALAAIKRD
jgi:hypothetical protein